MRANPLLKLTKPNYYRQFHF